MHRACFLASGPGGGGGIKGYQVPGTEVVRITVTNGAKRVYVDWPDGRVTDHAVPSTGIVEIEIPPGTREGIVTVSDMRIPDPADAIFPIS